MPVGASGRPVWPAPGRGDGCVSSRGDTGGWTSAWGVRHGGDTNQQGMDGMPWIVVRLTQDTACGGRAGDFVHYDPRTGTAQLVRPVALTGRDLAIAAGRALQDGITEPVWPPTLTPDELQGRLAPRRLPRRLSGPQRLWRLLRLA